VCGMPIVVVIAINELVTEAGLLLLGSAEMLVMCW